MVEQINRATKITCTDQRKIALMTCFCRPQDKPAACKIDTFDSAAFDICAQRGAFKTDRCPRTSSGGIVSRKVSFVSATCASPSRLITRMGPSSGISKLPRMPSPLIAPPSTRSETQRRVRGRTFSGHSSASSNVSTCSALTSRSRRWGCQFELISTLAVSASWRVHAHQSLHV